MSVTTVYTNQAIFAGVIFRNAAGDEIHPTEDFPSWSTSDEGVATINTIGTVNSTTIQIMPTGVEGSVTITCQWRGVTATTEVEILDPTGSDDQPTSVEISVWTQGPTPEA